MTELTSRGFSALCSLQCNCALQLRCCNTV